MICIRSVQTLRVPLLRSSSFSSHQPNAPLDLDKSFRTVLRDIDSSITKQKAKGPRPPRDIHELTAFPTDSTSTEWSHQDSELTSRLERKSPAALFGSQQQGAVIIPQELQQSISELISGEDVTILKRCTGYLQRSDSDRRLLRRDAMRLFNDGGDGNNWALALDVHYKSYKQARLHAERDSTAFASVVLPAHYSAIYAVLHHVKSRLGPRWSVQNVLDWGAGTGSALWATSYAFQSPNFSNCGDEDPEVTLSSTAITKYVGIEKRDGLVSIGKRLLQDIPHDSVNIAWQRKFHHDSFGKTHDGSSTIAISAFFLSTLRTSLQRKSLVKEMWESGADTIVLLDHSSPLGFQSVAEARELLLSLGRREVENRDLDENTASGSHVLAPCPHDGVCPIYQSNDAKLVCGFSQRMERPPFVRRTKHSGVGHEDIGYAYVVIRRGLRPRIPDVKVGRLGEIGRQQIQLEEAKRPLVELELADGNPQTAPEPVTAYTFPEKRLEAHNPNSAEIDTLLKAEAFHWPRLVFPPLKRSGHVVMDICSPSGKILRMTVTKSQGKQPYYDARKSRWGDIFPHEPKNPPQVRFPQHQGGRSDLGIPGTTLSDHVTRTGQSISVSVASTNAGINNQVDGNYPTTTEMNAELRGEAETSGATMARFSLIRGRKLA